MGKYWCDLCKTFVLESKAGRAQHESSPRHRSNFERQLSSIQRARKEKEREEMEEMRALQRMGVNVNKPASPHNSQRSAKITTSTTKNSITKHTDKHSTVSGSDNISLGVVQAIPESGLVAQPGSWTVLEANDKKRGHDEVKDGSETLEEDEFKLETKVYKPKLDMSKVTKVEAPKKTVFKKRRVKT